MEVMRYVGSHWMDLLGDDTLSLCMRILFLLCMCYNLSDESLLECMVWVWHVTIVDD